MPSISSVLGLFLLLNVLSLCFILLFYSHPEDTSQTNLVTLVPQAFRGSGQNADWKFTDPDIALKLLTQLDVFSTAKNKGNNSGKHWWRLPEGYDYCKKHREFFVQNPTFVLDRPKFVTSYYDTHILRKKIIPALGKDITHRGAKDDPPFVDDKLLAANFFVTFYLTYNQRRVGDQFACLTQAFNHIPGHDKIYRKDFVSQGIVNYAEGYKTRPQCFSYEKYFPKTFVLQDKKQCLEFFEEFLSPKYQEMKKERKVVYFRKIGANVHEGKGVFPVNGNEELKIMNLYKNGSECGNVMQNNLIQYNIYNLLLVENRKFGFRSFLLVASTNPLIAYYHDGYARMSLNEYDPGSNETSTFVTNIGLNKLNEKFAGWSKLQIDDFTYWKLDEFVDHLYKNGIVKDKNWLENHLRKEFMKVKIHLLRMAQDGFFKISSLYELYGLDYVMDENLNLWFIECNTMPLINGFHGPSSELFYQMLTDTFEIVGGLMKSRVKRIVEYINKLSAESRDGELENVHESRFEFLQVTKNSFEPEFAPRSKNSFYKIIDETIEGDGKYLGHIDSECIPRTVKKSNGFLGDDEDVDEKQEKDDDSDFDEKSGDSDQKLNFDDNDDGDDGDDGDDDFDDDNNDSLTQKDDITDDNGDDNDDLDFDADY